MNRRKFLKMTSKATLDIASGHIPSLYAVDENVSVYDSLFHRDGTMTHTKCKGVGKIIEVRPRSNTSFKSGLHFYIVEMSDKNIWYVFEHSMRLLK